MTRIKLIKNERRTFGESDGPVIGVFSYRGKTVEFEYDGDDGIISTGTDLILKYLRASDKFAALVDRALSWNKSDFEMNPSLVNAFKDSKVHVDYWNEPSQDFEDPGDGGFRAELIVRKANDAAKVVLQAFMLDVVSYVAGDDYVPAYWDYSAERIPAIISELKKSSDFMQYAGEVGCPIEDVKKAFEASVTEAVINSLGNEYRALDGAKVEDG